MPASLSILNLIYLLFILTSNFKTLGGFHIFGNVQKSNLIKHTAEIKNSHNRLYSSKDDDQNDFFYGAAVNQKNAIYRNKNEDSNSGNSVLIMQRLLNLYLKYLQTDKTSSEFSKFRFNWKNLNKFHIEIICSMIRSGVGPLNGTVHTSPSQHLQLPAGYLAAKDFFSEMLLFLQSKAPTTTFTLVKSILKKEGIRFTNDNGMISFDSYEEDFEGNGRAVVTLKRRIERALSETLLFLTALKDAELQANNRDEYTEDVTFFSRSIIDRLPAQDRHLHLLLFARIQSTFLDRATGSSDSDESIGRMVAPNHQISSEKNLFLQTLRSDPYYIAKPSAAARLLFPFSAASLRAYQTYRSHALGRTKDTKEVDVFPLLFFCMDFDRRAAAQRASTGCGEDMLGSIRRLLVDRTAFAVISAAGSTQEVQKGKGSVYDDDCIRLNTVAMELLSFRAVGTDMFRVLAEVGRYCSLLVRAVVRAQEEQDLQVECDARMIMLKKLLVLLSSMKYLPSGHKLVRSIDVPLGLQSIRSTNIHDIKSFRASALNADSASDDDFFSFDKKKTSTTRKVASIGSGHADDDELFWEKKNIRSMRSSKPDVFRITAYTPEMEDRVLDSVDNHLMHLFAEVFQVDKSILESSRVRDEIDYVLSTWRRPQLLLDYFYMHDTSPDTQNLFRRFLKALLAVSQESVEDIRFNDPLNRLHLDKFDPGVIAAWRDGRTADGELLPGYNDPQTLFMMGEDSNTCLSIRAKQKATNRGLLSLLLNGGCRVLGEKDASGKLLSRAVVRLLLDGRSQRPVLLVGRPYGGSGSSDDERCIEIFDQAGALGRLLRLPVLYSSPPPESSYFMGFGEAATAPEPDLGSSAADSCPLVDYSQLVDYVWVGGGQFARLIRRSEQSKDAIGGLSNGVALGWRSSGVLEEMPVIDDYQDDARFHPVFRSTTHLRGRFRASEPTVGSKDGAMPPENAEPRLEAGVAEGGRLSNADDEFFSYTLPSKGPPRRKRVSDRAANRGTTVPASTRPSSDLPTGGEEEVTVDKLPASKKQGAGRAASSISVQERLFLRQQLLSQSFQQQKQQRVPLAAVLQKQDGTQDQPELISQQRDDTDAEDDDMFFG